MVYDRVREMNKSGKVPPGSDLKTTINSAINLTLSRTIITSFATLLSVLALAIFCKGEISDFAVAISLGIISGTYSTIYIAAPFTIYVNRYLVNKKAK